MRNTRSRLETRLAQLLATTPPLPARRTTGRTIDLVYLSNEDEDRLNSRRRE